MRLLILGLLFYLGYRIARKWLLGNMPQNPPKKSQDSVTAVDDIMVKDPFCKTYFPRRDGIHIHYHGQDLFFCKLECRDGFLSEQKKINPKKNE